MLKGGVIMSPMPNQAAIAEKAGAVAVMALDRVPPQIRPKGGVARMASPRKGQGNHGTLSIPSMAKCRIGDEYALGTPLRQNWSRQRLGSAKLSASKLELSTFRKRKTVQDETLRSRQSLGGTGIRA